MAFTTFSRPRLYLGQETPKQYLMKTLLSLISIGSCVLTMTACGSTKASHDVASSAVENLGCKASQSEMWDSFQRLKEEGESFPSAESLRSSLLAEGARKGWKSAAFDKYVDAFVNNYSVTVEGIRASFAPEDLGSWKKALAEMEVGIRVTPVHAELQSKIQTSLDELAAAEKTLQAACASDQGRAPAGETDPIVPSTTTAKDGVYKTVWEQILATQNPEVYGLRRALANAYQSCDVLSLPPMTADTPDVQGIHDYPGARPGGGHIRKIENLASLVKTDYYIHNQSLAKNTCFDVRKDPPIYNFGGKPYTTSKKPTVLDMFTHVNTGGPTLGIDCSGYVFTALAIAGLKMDPDPAKPLKPDQVWGIPSGAFKEPQSNNLRCLAKIVVSKTNSIQPGDIIAIDGHVLMVDSIGEDPFGLRKIASVGDCNSSKIKAANFDFVLAQSSPVKNGIGIDLIQAADYLGTSGTVHDGLIAYASAACRAKFGAAPNLSSSKLSIVRHKRTPECKTKALELSYDECVDSCQAL